jgi:hypothetical protein
MNGAVLMMLLGFTGLVGCIAVAGVWALSIHDSRQRRRDNIHRLRVGMLKSARRFAEADRRKAARHG